MLPVVLLALPLKLLRLWLPELEARDPHSLHARRKRDQVLAAVLVLGAYALQQLSKSCPVLVDASCIA